MGLKQTRQGEADTYESLLMDYASGALDEARALVISAHITLSPGARHIVQRCEIVGGSMLQTCCDPVAMKKGAMESVLSRLETAPKEEKSGMPQDTGQVPQCLARYLSGPCETLAWNEDKPGLQIYQVKTRCAEARAQMMKLDPGTEIKVSGKPSAAIALVIEGAFECEERSYGRGDIFLVSGEQILQWKADSEKGCLCVAARPTSPIHSLMKKLSGFFSRPA